MPERCGRNHSITRLLFSSTGLKAQGHNFHKRQSVGASVSVSFMTYWRMRAAAVRGRGVYTSGFTNKSLQITPPSAPSPRAAERKLRHSSRGLVLCVHVLVPSESGRSETPSKQEEDRLMAARRRRRGCRREGWCWLAVKWLDTNPTSISASRLVSMNHY